SVLDCLVHRIVDALDHAGENKAGFHPVLIGIHADHELLRPSLAVLAVLLNRIEGTKTGVSGGREQYICAFVDLGAGELLSFDRTSPCGFCNADVVRNHSDSWIDEPGALLIADFEFMNQRNIHTADEADCPAL